MTTRHEFLAALHDLVQPQRYLEIGVQFGHSLRLTAPTCAAIGVDPDPLCTAPPNARIYQTTSDQFFAETVFDPTGCDFAFIDGMHLVEYALRDFINCESIAAPGGTIVLDDVLPYNADIAGRVPLPGDWAGDVWKLYPILSSYRPDLHITMVNVEPTGVMVVQRLDPQDGPARLRAHYDEIERLWAHEFDERERRPFLLGSSLARTPGEALEHIGAIMEEGM